MEQHAAQQNGAQIPREGDPRRVLQQRSGMLSDQVSKLLISRVVMGPF
jgi:hypothetical protein